jgi:hypothetical protein
VREIIGPAGSAAQMLPPTVATFQILNEERNAAQQPLAIAWNASNRGAPENS